MADIDTQSILSDASNDREYHFSRTGSEYGNAVILSGLIDSNIDGHPQYSAREIAEMAMRPFENENAERLTEFLDEGFKHVKSGRDKKQRKTFEKARTHLKNVMLVHALANIDKLDDEHTRQLVNRVMGHRQIMPVKELSSKKIEKLADYIVEVNVKAGTADRNLSSEEYRQHVIKNLNRMNSNGGQAVLQTALKYFQKHGDIDTVAAHVKAMRITPESQDSTQAQEQPANTDLTTENDTVPDESEKPKQKQKEKTPVPQFAQDIVINYGSNSVSVTERLVNAFTIACVAEGAANAVENSKELEEAMQSCVKEDKTFDNVKAFSEFLDRAGIKYDVTKLNKDQTEFKFGEHSLAIPSVSKDKKAFVQTMINTRDQIMNTVQFKNTTQTQRQQIVDKFASASVDRDKAQKWLAKAASNYFNTEPTNLKMGQKQAQSISKSMKPTMEQSIKIK